MYLFLYYISKYCKIFYICKTLTIIFILYCIKQLLILYNKYKFIIDLFIIKNINLFLTY